jgi:Protein of unknown function (DUF3089)
MIFELPFDLIVMARSHPVIDPALYRPLLFGCLFGIEITTLLLLRLSPMVRLTRAAFFSFALMLGVFAAWALSGFGYPSAPLPTALNIASKILAFVTALTLFLPQRLTPGQAPGPDSSEQAQPASPPLVLNSSAFAQIADDPQLTGKPTGSSVPGGAGPHRRLLGGVLGSVLVLALVTAGCSSANPPAGRPGTAAGQASPVWLCRPGQAADPCAYNLAATTVTAGGTLEPATWPSSAAAAKFACFYVYPTDSLAKTGNTGLAVTQGLKFATIEQAAPFSRVCDVWAPLYRSQTLPSVLKGLAGDENLMRSTFTTAYDSVLPAWQWFLAHTASKPIILIGDSQGSAILIHLISAQLDHQPSVLRRLLVAILVGGNLQVASGKPVGSTFTNVPLCISATQTGCAIAFSTFPSQPPGRLSVWPAGPGCEPAVRADGHGRPAGRLRQPDNPRRRYRRPGSLSAYPHPARADRAGIHPMGHLPPALLGDLRTRRRGHLAPGHQPRRDQPRPACGKRGHRGRGGRPGMGLPRLRVRPHPGQPAPRRRRRGDCAGGEPLTHPAGHPTRTCRAYHHPERTRPNQPRNRTGPIAGTGESQMPITGWLTVWAACEF